ncbi:MAG: hypothetical protein ACREO4_03575 [Lysobacter sp.]
MRTGLSLGLAALFAATSVNATESREIQALDGFLAAKETEHRERYDALLQLGRAAGYDGILQCLQQSLVTWPKGPPGATSQQVAALVYSFQHDIAGRVLGTATPYPGTCDATAEQINQAGAKAIRGEVSESDRVRFADTIVVARAVGGGPKAGTVDGFRSGLHFVVDEAIKGELRKGSRFVLRQTSGADGTGEHIVISGDHATRPGQLYLVLASRGMYTLAVTQAKKQLPRSDRTHPGFVAYGGLLEVDPSDGSAVGKWGVTNIKSIRETVQLQRQGH